MGRAARHRYIYNYIKRTITNGHNMYILCRKQKHENIEKKISWKISMKNTHTSTENKCCIYIIFCSITAKCTSTYIYIERWIVFYRLDFLLLVVLPGFI